MYEVFRGDEKICELDEEELYYFVCDMRIRGITDYTIYKRD